MTVWTIPLEDVDRSATALVGGKGANLGGLIRVGAPVPAGFCLTVDAFRRFVESAGEFEKFLVRLDQADPEDRPGVAALAAAIDEYLTGLEMPAEISEALFAAWRECGSGHTYAVRSSATAEDLAGASFAGQHDTFLNVQGPDKLLDAVRRCWASVFSARAIDYRARRGFDHRAVDLAVVVQRLVDPEVSGVMFTADPISGHRGTVVVNAAFGLGEAIVSGLVNPDQYTVTASGRLEKVIAAKSLAILPDPDGGVRREDLPEDRRRAQALPDEAIIELAAIGLRLQEAFGGPQDVEWVWADGAFHIVQARPITTLYPLPEDPGDGRLHIFFSLGHQQMMTDAMKPLAFSTVRNYFPFGSKDARGESSVMREAGNRLFIDYTDLLHTRIGRMLFRHPAGTMDKRVGGAFLDVAQRPEFAVNHPFDPARILRVNRNVLRTLGNVFADITYRRVSHAEPRRRAYILREAARTRAAIDHLTGAERIAAIQRDMRKTKTVYFRLTTTQFSAAVSRMVIASLSRRWLGDDAESGALDKSLPGNVTTEMSLVIGGMADLVRGNAELLALLREPPEPFAMEALDAVPGGPEFRVALEAFLEEYGIRCPGELDITRERWHSRPALLFNGIVANATNGAAGEHRERFAAGEREAEQAEQRLLERVRATRFGMFRAPVLRRFIRVYRVMMGMREHQKYLTVHLYDTYGRAFRAEGAALAARGHLQDAQDVDFLSLHEIKLAAAGLETEGLREAVRERKEAYEAAKPLTAPRLMTGEGEILVGRRKHDAGEGVLTGLPVSAGVVEGRARVVLRPEDAELEDGSILVAPFTDPAWTPLFSAVRGMVVEVGGLMTHGAVVARELGLPAVVGVDDATKLIPDGAMIRIDGSAGIVEVLSPR